MSVGCATFVRSDPSWSQPVDLGLHNKSMAGAIVHVGCGTRYKAGRLSPSRHAFCEALAVNIEHMGATVLADWRDAAKVDVDAEADFDSLDEIDAGKSNKVWEDEPKGPLFRVDYVDRLSGAKVCDGWSILFFAMTFSMYPLVCDDPSEAELLFYDGDVFALQERVQLRLMGRKYMGIGALYFHAAKLWRSKAAAKRGDLIGGTVQNEVFRFYFKSRHALNVSHPPEAS